MIKFKYFFKILTSICVFVQLPACVSVYGTMGGITKAYEGEKKPLDQVAIIYSNRQGNESHTYLINVDGKIYGDRIVLGFPLVTHVLPGKHDIKVHCSFYSNKYSEPTIQVEVKSNQKYQLDCFSLDGEHAVGLIKEVDEVPNLSNRRTGLK
ncbi:hypothetical protein [Acinetobacter haemolyticus]|uniref:DUF2846 domain-containing protein n=1 Tax=Acinetobacter haemolyticus CIP 64.3 = MTCC 9819 TaxID=1217659 RepID=N9FG17_ACIHA|nr:hypothetical protein [Acinetobacter haemolyticus]AZN67651.1 hypothetical protein DX910_04475 [Acinetobacter haemolyticus]ENW21482.1 hypothetical protein F927_00296 [Acinetobacter haemolyticus CIP 64.3 = MTCC 9819]QXZ27461.1 hypothetical protein I6L22_04005 [Acinetobacter haemolyticus]SPT48875.1 Uncharacterised protein [Acinetobacter haemolyticus]SUU66880.1 Uncharacterised protein [Acinetobacter haemolyticus]